LLEVRGDRRISVFDNYLIEVDDKAAGILVRTGGAFAFHALEGSFATLEGALFADAVAAERAVRRVQRQPRGGFTLGAAAD
jgi:hypothetical protein